MKFTQSLVLLLFILSACSSKSIYEPPSQTTDIDLPNPRPFQAHASNVAPENLAEATKITLQTQYPVWRDSIGVTLDISIQNQSNALLSARAKGQLFVYDSETQKPLYWSNMDLAFSEPAGPQLMSILSIPIQGAKDLTVLVKQTTWARIDDVQWPSAGFYSLVPSGKHLMRFELTYYTEEDKPISTVVSNFITFSSTQMVPEDHLLQGQTP